MWCGVVSRNAAGGDVKWYDVIWYVWHCKANLCCTRRQVLWTNSLIQELQQITQCPGRLDENNVFPSNRNKHRNDSEFEVTHAKPSNGPLGSRHEQSSFQQQTPSILFLLLLTTSKNLFANSKGVHPFNSKWKYSKELFAKPTENCLQRFGLINVLSKPMLFPSSLKL